MLTNKAIIIAKEIDNARCKGQWKAIPELARRYKKHNPAGRVLEQSILAEAKLNEKKNTSYEAIQQQVASALHEKDNSTEINTQKEMARIILAQTYFEAKEYEKACKVLEEIDLNGKTELCPEYMRVAQLQETIIRAMSLDLLEKKSNSIQVYLNLVKQVNKIPNVTEKTMVDWAEEGLYRGVLAALSDGTAVSVPDTMSLIRAYQKICSSQGAMWRREKRLLVTKSSQEYLSRIYRNNAYQPPVDFDLTEDGKSLKGTADYDQAKNYYKHQLFSIEIMQLYTTYEKLIYVNAQFPRSGQHSQEVLEFVNKLACDFEMINSTSEQEIRGYIEALNRAAAKTFNSPCVTRHLFMGLMRLGDFEEAEYALHAYLYLTGLESMEEDSRHSVPALASDHFGCFTPMPPLQEHHHVDDAKKSPPKSEERETLENKVKVLVTAVGMYCKYLCKGTDAVRMAQLAKDVYHEDTIKALTPSDKHLLLGAEIYRVLGAATSFLASQTFDQTRRPEYHDSALKSLSTSLELDDTSWKTYYQMGYQHAVMRDIQAAIQACTQAVKLYPSHLPSWHLLALLCTCPVKGSFQQALSTCELALYQVATAIPQNRVDYSDEVAQQMSLKMTQTRLVELIQGAEPALALQSNLFQMFGKIVVPELIPDDSNQMLHEAISNGNTRYGMVLSGSLGNMSDTNNAFPTQAAERGRIRSASSASLSTQRSLQHGRTRSVSSFTGRKLHLAEMFKGPSDDAASVKSTPVAATTNTNHSKQSLLNPKSLIRKSKKEAIQQAMYGEDSYVVSGSSSILSNGTLLEQTSTYMNRPTTQARIQYRNSCRMLCDLWLLSAEAFLRAGKYDEALKAVSEAENIDWTTHAGVWCLLGRIRLAQNDPKRAIKAFEKGLVTQPNDVNCRVYLATTFIEQGQLEIAEGLLEAITQGNGWDCASAWYQLSQIYKQTQRIERTKDCLFYALELENTTPILPFTTLPHFV
ncbi:TPR-like protein [Backusella circina FSU 941]|nr:TPR-like protein [Backusella circina FSU 941]